MLLRSTPYELKPGPRNLLRRAAGLLMVLTLGACASAVPPSKPKDNAKLTPTTRLTRDLARLPEPKVKLPVAVYGFRDQTGQYKQSPDSAYSTAVTQGAASMLIMALKESGWYVPVEREGLQNLLTERRIVRAIESPLDKGKPAINLPNLTPASLLIEGGIVSYESNVRTGGKGANYLGIGASTQYRVDQVTVVLRSIDIKSGSVINSVSATKTIYSYQFSTNIYKFTAFRELLQGETGFTTNEPAQMALREAIELAVIQLTVDGIRDRNLVLKRPEDWSSPIIQQYAAADNANYAERGEGTPKEFVPMRSREAERKRVVSPSTPYDAESASSLAAKLLASQQGGAQLAATTANATSNTGANSTSSSTSIPSSVTVGSGGPTNTSSAQPNPSSFSESVMPLPKVTEMPSSAKAPSLELSAASNSDNGTVNSNLTGKSNNSNASTSVVSVSTSSAGNPEPNVNSSPTANSLQASDLSTKVLDSADPSDIFQMYFKKK